MQTRELDLLTTRERVSGGMHVTKNPHTPPCPGAGAEPTMLTPSHPQQFLSKAVSEASVAAVPDSFQGSLPLAFPGEAFY